MSFNDLERGTGSPSSGRKGSYYGSSSVSGGKYIATAFPFKP